MEFDISQVSCIRVEPENKDSYPQETMYYFVSDISDVRNKKISVGDFP